MMKVAIEVEPYLRPYSGIAEYFTELVSRLSLYDDITFCGHMFNFAHRKTPEDIGKALHMPIQDNALMSYGIYRRVWHFYRPCPQGNLPHRQRDSALQSLIFSTLERSSPGRTSVGLSARSSD